VQPPAAPAEAGGGLLGALRAAFAWSAALSAGGLLIAMWLLPPVMVELYAGFGGALPAFSQRMFGSGWRWLGAGLFVLQVIAAAKRAPAAISTPLLVAQAALGVAFGVAAMLPLVELPFAVVQE
jgi:hypothetical protein